METARIDEERGDLPTMQRGMNVRVLERPACSLEGTPPDMLQSFTTMTREEYDERRRRIEEQHRTTIELIEAGRLAQLRALDQVWLLHAAESEPISLQAAEATLELLAERDGSSSSPETPRHPEPAPAPAKRRRPYELLEQIEAALPSLPDPFDYHDLCRVLGIELDRGAVRRNLDLLVEEEILGKEGTSSGRFRLLYTKLSQGATPTDD